MQKFSASPQEMFASLWRHRDLIRVSARREILSRYKGTVFGVVWSFLNPLLMLSVYTVVFGSVFRTQWVLTGESKPHFALTLFSGLMVFNFFSECVTRAPVLIVANVNYVKKVVYPLETMPFVVVVGALYNSLVSLMVWVLAYLVLVGGPHWTIVLLPVVVAPLLFFTLGMCWVLASLGVFLRDVTQVVGVATSILMFLSPVFYPVAAFPADYRALIYLNPLTSVVEQVRGVLVWGDLPNIPSLAAAWLITAAIAWLGFVWFQRTRRGFADVL